MTARRTLVALAVLLTALAFGAALEAEKRGEKTATRPVEAPKGASPPSRTIAATMTASSPARPTLRARVGDLVELTVASSETGAVTVDGYDRSEPVEARTPARLSFIVRQAGSFPVRFRRSRADASESREGRQGRLIGLLVVEEAPANDRPESLSGAR